MKKTTKIAVNMRLGEETLQELEEIGLEVLGTTNRSTIFRYITKQAYREFKKKQAEENQKDNYYD